MLALDAVIAVSKPHIINRTWSDVTVECWRCHKTQVIAMLDIEIHDWLINKKVIQLVCPHLTPEQREFLVSGTCDTCFNNLFDEED